MNAIETEPLERTRVRMVVGIDLIGWDEVRVVLWAAVGILSSVIGGSIGTFLVDVLMGD
jgi:hypothetical protein